MQRDDGQRSDRERDLELDPYNLFNLNTGLLYDTWEVMLYVKNITDENPQQSFDRERGGRARPRRTFGLSRLGQPSPPPLHRHPANPSTGSASTSERDVLRLPSSHPTSLSP